MNAVTAILVLLAALNTILLVLVWRAGASGAQAGVDARLKETEDRLGRSVREEFARNRQESAEQGRQLREELTAGTIKSGESIVKHVGVLTQTNDQKLGEIRTAMDQLIDRTAQRLSEVRGAVEQKLGEIQTDNAARLEQMRATVDEKLQSTLETRLGESFRQVSAQLEAVYKGLGEMQTLASGVGDLKKVLTNVKTRGTWGEVQLGNLLEQMLGPEQYASNVMVQPGSGERVEFAVKLPGRVEGGEPVWLPIDAKFPQEDYQRLVEASERGDAEAVASAGQGLEARIVAEAKKIKEKYIHPPHTTDFAILFLPTEGLYAELLRRPGMDDRMRRERVMLAGPTNLAAMLNSLQMGFRTLAIEKRTSEVWQVLGAVKAEFGKFGEVLGKVQEKLHQASQTIEDAQRRSRVMTKRLKDVEELPEDQAQKILPGMETLVGEDDEIRAAGDL